MRAPSRRRVAAYTRPEHRLPRASRCALSATDPRAARPIHTQTPVWLADAAASLQEQAAGRPCGLGIDLVEVAEFERLPFPKHRAFYQRCFSLAECHYCLAQPIPARSFAARFAAKEAAVKAFSGLQSLGYWQVEVRHAETGAPALHLWNVEQTGPIAETERYQTLLSLTHTDTLAAAIVLLYKVET